MLRTVDMREFVSGVALATTALFLAACAGPSGEVPGSGDVGSAPKDGAASSASDVLDETTDIGAGRRLYVRCTGTGSPTVVLEAGDTDTSDSYAFAESTIAKTTRTCVYDRANLGRSDPDPGPRGLPDLVGDLERLLEAAAIPAPYVLVGTSGGGYITAGYASAHPGEVAGMVFVETAAPFRNPPRPIVEETTWSHPSNVEQRDYLQVEKDAWSARKLIGDIPVTIVTDSPSADAIHGAAFPSEKRGMRRNVSDQRGWLVLSPRAEQVIVHTGHAVEEEDPELVVDAILDVVKAAHGAGR